MKVLIVHNRYRSATPSGENRVVESDTDLLRAAGVDVELFVRDSDDIPGLTFAKKAMVPLDAIHSRSANRSFGDVLARFRPDVVHLHNAYPLISPAIIRTAHKAGTPVVHTVHNYRHTCVSGAYYRDDAICTECSGTRLPWPAIRHGCYRDSRLQSIPMAVSLVANHRTWNLVDRFLPVSRFNADDLEREGIPRERVEVVPNCVQDHGQPTSGGRGFLFAGRLSSEKGIRELLDAWTVSGLDENNQLVVAGDGPQRDDLEKVVKRCANVSAVGRLDAAQVRRAIDDACAVVIPSTCFESQPLVALEALSRGRPLIVPTHGALREFVDSGVAVGYSPPTFAKVLRQFAEGDHGEMMKRCREHYLGVHTPQAHTQALLGAYEHVLN